MSPGLRPMRVAQIVRPAAGGIRSHVRTLIQGFDPARVAAHLFAPEEFATLSPGTPHTTLDIASKTHLFRDPITIRRLSRMLDGSFDLVHCHGLRGALIGSFAANRCAIPSLFTVHNLVPPRRSHRLMLRCIAPLSQGIIAVSQAVLRSIQEAVPSFTRLRVIPNGIDLAPYQAKGARRAARAALLLPPDGHLILGLGRLAPEKGFDLLIRAFLALDPIGKSSPPILALAGTGPEEAALKRLAADHPASIYFLGHVEAVAPLLAAADLVVIPSRTEGQGMVALEAMAAGRPLVAASVGGLIETLGGGTRGVLTPPENPAALAEAMQRLLDAPKERRRLGDLGRSTAKTEFSAELMVSRTTQLYCELLRAHRQVQQPGDPFPGPARREK